MELLEKASEEPPDVDLQRGLLDYFLDGSFVPATARGLADVVNEQAIIARVSRGRHLLQEDISRRVRLLRNSLNANLQHLANIDSIEKMRRQWDEFQCKISILANTESEQRATRDNLFSYTKGTCAARLGAVTPEAAKLREQMKADLRTTVSESSKWEMSGPRTYSIFDTFDAKLAAWCSDQIRELRSDLQVACARYQFISQNALELPYTLHRQASDDDQINDHEKFFESFETTISRMQQQADRKSKWIEDAITQAFQGKLYTIASSIHQAASVPLEHTLQEIRQSQRNASELKWNIENLEAGIPASKDLLKTRISKLETTIDTMEGFQKALTACGAPVRQ